MEWTVGARWNGEEMVSGRTQDTRDIHGRTVRAEDVAVKQSYVYGTSPSKLEASGMKLWPKRGALSLWRGTDYLLGDAITSREATTC